MSPSRTAASASSTSTPTSSVETQTSPADVRLSHVDAQELRLWASAFAPARWLAWHQVGDGSGDGAAVSQGARDDRAKDGLSFLHVTQSSTDLALICDREVVLSPSTPTSSSESETGSETGFRLTCPKHAAVRNVESSGDRRNEDDSRDSNDRLGSSIGDKIVTNLMDIFDSLERIEEIPSRSSVVKDKKRLVMPKVEEADRSSSLHARSVASVTSEPLKANDSTEENFTMDVGSESRVPDAEDSSRSLQPEFDSDAKEEEESQRRLAEKTCSTCGRKFASKKSRLRHEVSHSSARPFACEFCGKAFKLKQAVYEHQRNMHPFQYLASKHARDGGVKTRRGIDIKDASKTTAVEKKHDPIAVANGDVDDDDDDDREEHGNEKDADGSHRRRRGGGDDPKTKVISCHLCDEKLKDKKDYEDHAIACHGADGGGGGGCGGQTKEEIFFKKCPICSKCCKTPGLMKLHMRDAHSDPFARFECEFCGQKFKKKTLLTQHVAYRHKERSVPCPHCDKVYATVYDLKRHAVHHDESLKPRCGVCDRVFTTKVNLRKHVEKYHDNVATGVGAANVAPVSGVRKSRAPVAGQKSGGNQRRPSRGGAGNASTKYSIKDSAVNRPTPSTASTTSLASAAVSTAKSSHSAVDPSIGRDLKRSTVDARYQIDASSAVIDAGCASSDDVVVASSSADASTLACRGATSATAGVVGSAASAGVTSLTSVAVTPTTTMVAETAMSTDAHFVEAQPQLATLELVTTEQSDEGTSLTLALQPLSSNSHHHRVSHTSRPLSVLQTRGGKILQLSTLIRQPSQQPQIQHSFLNSQLQFTSTSEGPALVFTPTTSPVVTADGTFQQLTAAEQLPIGHVITAISLPTDPGEDNRGQVHISMD